MDFYKRIKENGRKISDKYAGTDDYFYLNPGNLILVDALKPLFPKYVKGKLLDSGAGRLANKFLLEPYCDKYYSVDIATRTGRIDVIGDIQRMGFKDSSFDTVFCSQVLEHLPEPQKAISELYRILRKNGHLILSTPHMTYLHNEPHDYYRYTKHGLNFMLGKTGFETVLIEPNGGIVTILGHIPSVIFLSLLYNIPIIFPLAFEVNRIYVQMVCWLDKLVEKQKVYALNNVVVAQK